jgi:chromosome segregation ATPase
MARENLADRIKNGPLTPRWKQVVAKNKGIDDLKGDIDGPVGDYDANLKAGADVDGDLVKAWEAMTSAIGAGLTTANKALDEHRKALDKLGKDQNARWAKTSTDANKLSQTDVAAALDVVSKLVDDNDNFAQQANELHKAMVDAREALDDAIEKAYANARKAVDGIQAQKKKLEDDCNKLDDTLHKTITDIQKQAIKANQDKVADALAGFLKAV